MVNYEFRYVVKMTNGKEYEIITNSHGKKDVLKYIDSHDYIELFDRKIEEMVAVKSEYVMSVLYKDSQKTDSEGNVNWANREDYLKEENERPQQENEQLKKEEKVNRTKASLLTEIKILKDSNDISKPTEELEKVYRKSRAFDKVLKIDNQATDADRITGEYESAIETVISEYNERVDDERYKNTDSKNDNLNKYIDRLDDDNIMG